MSEFGNDSPSHLPWRDQHLERDTSSGVSTEQDSQQGHRPSQPHLYDHYTTPPTVSENEEWSSSAPHDSHGLVGSPHSQTSTGSMIDSPQSQQSESRRSVDMTASGGSGHGDSQHMSLSERRQEKRKMKRFRLTHNQTRFLMSEFARQAHPDAAHRERLAREIPGLSPRQVQVWFQNRRAKLKRMSSDDRERMMKSRALPEEFPILQTLHTYGARMMGTPVASPTEYSPNTTGGMYHRPDPLRRRHLGDDEVAVSPTTPAYGLSFTPTTPSSGEILSPVSTSGERSGYLGYMTSTLGPQQRGNPFSRATDPYRAHPSVPRLQLHDPPRSLGETAGSPLATSTTYSGNLSGHDDYQHSPSGYSLQGNFAHAYPSPAPPSAHSRPPSFPPPLTLSDFKYSQPPLTPHSGTLSGFATAPLAPPQEYQIPQMSAPADATSFSSSYMTRSGTGSLGSASAHNAPGSGAPHENGRAATPNGREYGHQRKRSSSHPPTFAGRDS